MFLEYLKSGQLYQFSITLLVMIFYGTSVWRGSPDDTLKSILLVVVGYWFATVAVKPTLDIVTTKVQQLDDTIKSQVITNQSVKNQQVDNQTVNK